MSKTKSPNESLGDVTDQELTKSLTFDLTIEETAAKGKCAAEIRHELTKMREEFKELQATLKGKIAQKEQELAKTLRLIRDGKEERTVSCIMRKDFTRMIVQFLFGDKVQEERALTIEERQLNLDEQRKKREGTKKPQGIEQPTSRQAELKQVIREETNAKTKADLVV